MTGLNFRFYRIETDNPVFEGISIEEIPQKIVDEYNRSKGEQIYTALEASENGGKLDENKKIIFFKKNIEITLPHSWKRFFEEVEVDFGPISTEMHHIVGFIADLEKTQLLTISTGQAYVTFEKYVDYNFPIEVAKKIVEPEIKAGEVRSLTGYLQASSLHFRRPRRISVAEAVSSVWTQLSGSLSSDILARDEFKEIFGEKKKVSIEVKASIGIKQRVSSPTLLAKYIDWLLDVYLNYPIPPGSQEHFGFLESIKKLSSRRHVDILEDLHSHLLQKIRSLDLEDFALCHRDYSLYLGADSYQRIFDRTPTSYDHAPNPEEILSDLEPTSTNTEDVLEKCRVIAKHDSEEWNNREGSVEELLCGELSIGNHTYFLLNKEWYELRNDFIEIIKGNFDELVSDSAFSAGLNLGRWTQAREYQFNLTFNGRANFIVGDTVFYRKHRAF